MVRGLMKLTALLVCMAALPAMAAEGRIPIWAPITLCAPCGDTINGKYIVTRNITAPPGAPAIEVIGTGFEEVDILIDGKTLFGDPAGGVDIVKVSGVRTFVLRDGSIRPQGPPPGNGVTVEDTGKTILEDLRIDDGGNGLALLKVPSFQVRRNTIVAAGENGILVDALGGAASPSTGQIEDNVIKNTGLTGILVTDNTAGVAVVDNRIDRTFNEHGIHLQAGNTCLVSRNTVQGANLEGIFLESMTGCKVHNNVANFSGSNGILLVDVFDSLILDNVSGQNGRSGIEHQGAFDHFDKNVTSDNGCYGIHLAGRDNTYGRNTARQNTGAACAAPCGVAPVEVCTPPYGGGAFAPDLCVDAVGNTSMCDNLMPGPPRS